MNADLAGRIVSFLTAYHVMSLATAGSAGIHAANLFYACDGLALVWVSDSDARHSRAIAADPRVAATIAPDYVDFPVIRGLQIAGMARRVTEPEQQRCLGLLEARYPFLRELAHLPEDLRAAYARAAVYRLQPARIVLIDNTKGFGHKETLELSE